MCNGTKIDSGDLEAFFSLLVFSFVKNVVF